MAADAAFAPDGAAIAVVSRIAPRVRLWGRDGEPLGNLPGHSAIVTSVAFSPDGTRLVTAGGDGAARIWTRDGAEVATLSHTSPVSNAQFSHDGRYVLTGTADGWVRLWYARTDELVRVADERIVRDFTPAERRRFAELLEGD